MSEFYYISHLYEDFEGLPSLLIYAEKMKCFVMMQFNLQVKQKRQVLILL